MKQATVQISEAISIDNESLVGRVGTKLPSSATTMRAVAPKGHEGHVMPMSPKPAAVKPANEKTKPKAPPKPPAAKPPAKMAKSCRRVERRCGKRSKAPTPSLSRYPGSPGI